MPLKTILESLDAIPEALKPFYLEIDGKFILQLEGADQLPEIASLKASYAQEKDKRSALEAEITSLKSDIAKLPADFDIKIWEEAKAGKPDEAALISERKALEAERDQHKTRADKAEASLSRIVIERGLDEALAENGVTHPPYLKAARAMLAGSVTLSAENTAIVESDMGPKPLGEYIKRWVAADGKDFVTPPKGGGAPGSDTPGSNKKFSEMSSGELVALRRSNPEEYERLKKAS